MTEPPYVDPMDIYSDPRSITPSPGRLATIFQLRVREATPEKPGRDLTVLWDARRPFMVAKYVYLVNLHAPGHFAGNHFHGVKEEMFHLVSGKATLYLADLATGAREQIELDASLHQAIYIAPPIAHAVVAQMDNTVLLVIASHPNTLDDEFALSVSLV